MPVMIPREPDAVIEIGERRVALTNLDKMFFPTAGFTKRDLLQ
jgi:DNA primase